MKRNLLFEQDENWDTVLREFKSVKAINEELGKYGDVENQVLCHERVEELEPSIRYCLHKLLQIGEMEDRSSRPSTTAICRPCSTSLPHAPSLATSPFMPVGVSTSALKPAYFCSISAVHPREGKPPLPSDS